jgi:ABC-type lipoprotein export system ATPase subunit
MVQIRDLEFRYFSGEFRLGIPQFTVDKSEKIAVIGPSGSGKTTLLNLISGILLPERGAVSVGDTRVNALKDDDRRDFRIRTIGFVFQDFELLDYLNVLDNILHPFRITQALVLNDTVRERAAQLAEEMGIGDKLRRKANDLSQGEKQRAAICRALLPRPRLLLADEATGNLDPVNKMKILDLLFRSVESHEATLLAVTHDHELLPRFDRVVDFEAFRCSNGDQRTSS